MFKDFNKYFKASLKVYLFLLVCCFIMKVVGLDYFGLDLDNEIVIKTTDFLRKNVLINNLILFFPLAFNHYFYISYTCNDNSQKMKEYNVVLIPIFCILQAFKMNVFGSFSFIAEMIYFLVACYIYKKKEFNIKRFVKATVIILFVQIISMLTRYNYSIEYIQNPVANFILNLDYLLSLIIIYKLNFMKGGNKSWTDGSQVDQFSSLPKKNHFSTSLENLQKNYSNFKKLSKQEKATIIIYSVLSLFWNIFTLVVVLFIGKLNDTFVECIFIITSFWLSKRVFGKPFHLKSMAQCFILSNATYYLLNRITTPLGISMLVPIMLGVGLSYITSKLVKKSYKPLYRGMPKDLFEETITKVVEKDSDKYKICYDFFIEKQNAILLSHKYNYTEAGIRKITSRVNDSIKALNK